MSVTGGENTIIKEDLVISKLNGEDLSFKLVRALLRAPKNDDPLEITHMVNGEAEILTVVPSIGKGNMNHEILPLKEMSESQQLLYNKLFTSKR